MQLEAIEQALVKAEKAYERESGVVAALAHRGTQATTAAQQAKELAHRYDVAATALNRFSDQRQGEVIATIEAIASKGLSQIFDEDIELKITPVVRARRLEFDITVRTGDLETSVLDARGGGLAAVTGFILRACVVLLNPEARNFLALDEVFAHLSEDYVSRAAEFLHTLCEETGMQILLVTHQSEFVEHADTVYRIERDGMNTAKFVKQT